MVEIITLVTCVILGLASIGNSIGVYYLTQAVKHISDQTELLSKRIDQRTDNTAEQTEAKYKDEYYI